MADDRKIARAFAQLVRKNPAAACAVAVVLVVALAWGSVASISAVQTDAASDASQETAQVGNALQQVEVERVVDGDTLKVRVAGSKKTVRLIGMDTPESVAKEESRNCEEGVIASEYTKSLVGPGQTVWLSRDVSDTDKYGRLLRYVWLDRPSDSPNDDEIAYKMLNAILVRDGYAQVKRYKPDTTLHDLFQRWGDEAIAEGRGVTYKWA